MFADILSLSDVVREKKTSGVSEVSVLVTLFNYEGYILEALESVKAQTIPAIDLYIIDDCSSDSSSLVVADWFDRNSERFKNFTILKNKKNEEVVRSRNILISYSESPYLFILDADNIIFPRCIERLLKTIKNGSASFAYPIIEKFGSETSLMNTMPWDPSKLILENTVDAMALFRRDILLEIGGYSDMPYHGLEDYELWFKIIEAGGFGVQAPEILARYRCHPNSKNNLIAIPNSEVLINFIKKKHKTFFDSYKSK